MGRWLERAITLHRWLGLAVGPLMVVWCASGMVMIYMPYPRLTEATRRSALEPLAWPERVARSFDAPGPGPLEPESIEMLGGRAVLRTDRGSMVEVESGALVPALTAEQAARVAVGFAARLAASGSEPAAPELLGVVDRDVWTFSGVPGYERPLYRFAFANAAGTEVYVSRVSGKVVQATTRTQRAWTWVGAIPHWLYLAALRRHARIWASVVVIASLAGSFLAALGLGIGVVQLTGRGRPRSGALYAAHHSTGLVFGVVTLTWVLSGLLSMNPAGVLESGDDRSARAGLRGEPSSASLWAALGALARSPARETAVHVEVAPLSGHVYFVFDDGNGHRARVDETGGGAPLLHGDLRRALDPLTGGAALELLDTSDDYLRNVERKPVYRAVTEDPERTRYYVDALSGQLRAVLDRNARGYRWLFEVPHRLDVPLLRGRPQWDIVMLVLLSGALGLSATGLLLGARRWWTANRPGGR